MSEPSRQQKMVNAAQWLAQQGCYIGWGQASDGKAVKRHWKSDMTNDPALVPPLLHGQRNSLVIPAGKVITLDLDKHGGYEALTAEGMPDTFRVFSPTQRPTPDGSTFRGRHVYGLSPDGYDVTSLPGTFEWGEVRRSVGGEQSMLLGPWAMRSDGIYEPDPTAPRTLATFPAGMLDFIRLHPKLPVGAVRLDGQAIIRIPLADDGDWQWEDEGGRHDHLLGRIRVWRGHGMTGEALRANAWTYVERHGMNQPGWRPIDKDEVERMAAGAETKYGDDPPFEVTSAPTPLPVTPAGTTQDDEVFKALTAGLVYVSQATPSPTANDWRIEGLMRLKGLVVLAAPEGIGKSWARTELAIRLACGHGALFDVYPVRGKHAVLLLDEENGEDIEFEREDDILDALGLTRADLGGNYLRMSFGMTDLETKDGRIAFETRIDAASPHVVIIDTGGVTVGEEFGPTFARSMRYVRSVSEKFAIVVVFIVHLVKPLRETKERAAAMREGRALVEVMGHWGRHADSVWQMSEAEGGRVRFSVRKRWGESENLLARDNSLWKAVKVVTETKSSVAAAARLRMLGALKHLGRATSGRVGEWLAKDAAGPISPAALSRHFKALTEDGSVSRDAEAHWALTAKGEAALSSLAMGGVTLVVPRADEG